MNFGRGTSWYRTRFPSVIRRLREGRGHRHPLTTGEASPYCLFLSPPRPQEALEDHSRAKLIVLLRNPVHRAYSHYNDQVSFGHERLSFEEAARREERRLSDATGLREDGTYCSYAHHHYSYLSSGIYVGQLLRWMDLFPREQILILQSEKFYHDPAETYRQVLSFLELPKSPLTKDRAYNKGGTNR